MLGSLTRGKVASYASLNIPLVSIDYHTTGRVGGVVQSHFQDNNIYSSPETGCDVTVLRKKILRKKRVYLKILSLHVKQVTCYLKHVKT